MLGERFGAPLSDAGTISILASGREQWRQRDTIFAWSIALATVCASNSCGDDLYGPIVTAGVFPSR